MNTRTAVLTLAFATLNIAALAVSTGTGATVPVAPGHLLVVTPGGIIDESGLPQAVTGLTAPQDLLFAPDGSLLVSDDGTDSVRVFEGFGLPLGSIGAGTGLVDPTGLALGSDGRLYVASSGTDNVFEYDRDGLMLGSFGATSGLDSPWGVAVGPGGRIYVASSGTDTIFVFDASGVFLHELGIGTTLSSPRDLCFGDDGHLFVSSFGNNLVLEFDGNGELQASFGLSSALTSPVGLCFGPDGFLYVSSADGSIFVYDRDGIPKGSFGGLSSPSAIAFSPYVFDSSLKLTIENAAGGEQKVKGNAWLMVSPFSPTVTVQLQDGSNPLATVFGTDTFVMNGFGAAHDATNKELVWNGHQLPADITAAFASALITLRDTAGGGDGPAGGALGNALFIVKKADGDLQVSGPGGVASGSIKAGKLLKP